MKNTKLAQIMGGAAVAALVLTGCGNGADTASTGSAATGTTSSPASAEGEHNEADVEFARGMLVHHRQAVEMAGLAVGRSENAQLLDLAARISAEQTPEIATLTGWLQKWGAEVPAEGAMSSGGMGGMSGGGMMSPEQMQSLEQADGVAFDRLFLDMMVEHHKGAVEMAQTELDKGADPQAEQLAQAIIDTQQREITEMETLLAQL